MAADAPDAADPSPTGFSTYADEDVPQMAVGSAGKRGELELVFAAEEGSPTRLVHDFARVPYHVSGTLGGDPHPHASTVFVQSPTGGIAQGDRLRADVEVRAGAIAHVTTQSATKVQSMDANYAEAAVGLRVGPGAHLDYVPEPTILYADARYCQELTLEVDPDGSAFLADVVVPGRLARGERFEFDRYHARVRAVDGDALQFEEATDLAPDRDDPTAVGVVTDAAVYGTCYVVDPGGDSGRLSDAIHDALPDGDVCAGATTLPNDAGVLVRLLGERTETVREGVLAAWDVARREILGVPAPERRRF